MLCSYRKDWSMFCNICIYKKKIVERVSFTIRLPCEPLQPKIHICDKFVMRSIEPSKNAQSKHLWRRLCLHEHFFWFYFSLFYFTSFSGIWCCFPIKPTPIPPNPHNHNLYTHICIRCWPHFGNQFGWRRLTFINALNQLQFLNLRAFFMDFIWIDFLFWRNLSILVSG